MHFNSETIRDGVEISNKYACVAKERGLKVFCNNIQNIDFEKKYDVVTAYAVVEHLTDPLSFLTKIQSIIKPGGILVIMVPSFECLLVTFLDKYTNKQWRMYTPPEHLNYMSMHFLDNFLNNKGLTLVDRYWTSGGVINPLRNIPILSVIFKGLMFGFDESIANKLPLFDHQYSIYKKS
jgi:SAM-dependent methyltransferase